MTLVPPLGGRIVACADSYPIRRFFGRAAINATVPGQPDAATDIVAARECCDTGPGVFVVSSSAVSLFRETLATIAPVAPEAFNGVAPGGGSAAKLEIVASLGSNQRRFRVDLNTTIEVNADKVAASFVMPTGWVQILNGTVAVAGPGLIEDVQAGIGIARAEESVGKHYGYLTTWAFVPQNSAGVIVIPSYATSVTISQTAAGAASTVWALVLGGIGAPGVDVGSIDFADRQTASCCSTLGATTLRTDVDAASARLYTLRWRIEP